MQIKIIETNNIDDLEQDVNNWYRTIAKESEESEEIQIYDQKFAVYSNNNHAFPSYIIVIWYRKVQNKSQ